MLRNISKAVFSRRGIGRRAYSSNAKKDLIRSLQQRGLINAITSENVQQIINEQQVSIYAGFDPTSDSLHAGNLLSIIMLTHFKNAGVKPIALVSFFIRYPLIYSVQLFFRNLWIIFCLPLQRSWSVTSRSEERRDWSATPAENQKKDNYYKKTPYKATWTEYQMCSKIVWVATSKSLITTIGTKTWALYIF